MSLIRFNHHNQGQRNLALSIIVDSIEDYVKPIREKTKGYTSEREQNREEASSFLFGNGTWKQSREAWCDIAGISSEKLILVKKMNWERFKLFKKEVYSQYYKNKLGRANERWT